MTVAKRRPRIYSGIKENGYVKLRRNLVAHFHDGKLTPNEFKTMLMLIIVAEPDSGSLETCASVVSEFWLGEFTEKEAQRALENLEKKNYIRRTITQGQRGLYPVIIDKYERTTGSRAGTRVDLPRNRTDVGLKPDCIATETGLKATSHLPSKSVTYMASNSRNRTETGLKPDCIATETGPIKEGEGEGESERQLQQQGAASLSGLEATRTKTPFLPTETSPANQGIQEVLQTARTENPPRISVQPREHRKAVEFDPIRWVMENENPVGEFPASEVRRIIWYHFRNADLSNPWWQVNGNIISEKRIATALPSMAKQVHPDYGIPGWAMSRLTAAEPSCERCKGAGVIKHRTPPALAPCTGLAPPQRLRSVPVCTRSESWGGNDRRSFRRRRRIPCCHYRQN